MNIVQRAQNIIMKPKTEWDVIAGEPATVGGIITGYVLIMALIPAVASFIGYGLIGTHIPFVGSVRSISWGIGQALISYLVSLLSVYIAALVIDALAPSFGSTKNMVKSVQLVAYSFTPMWVGGILNIYPPIAIIGSLFGLYGLYLLYVGLPKMMSTPQDKVVGYFVVSLIVMLIAYFVLGLIIAAIITPILLTGAMTGLHSY